MHGNEIERLRRREIELETENARLRSLVRQAGPDGGSSTAQLLQSHGRLQAILDSATDYAIIMTDAEGRITGWNVGAAAILGWQASEALGQPIAIIFTPEDRAAGMPAREMAEAAASGSAVDERWHMRRDGGRFWASGRLTPLKDGTGGFLKILRDRTDQRGIEEERLRLAAIAEQSSDFIGIARPDGQVIYVNRAGRRMTGIEADAELGSLTITDFFAPEDRGFFSDVILPAQIDQGAWSGEFRLRHFRTGAVFPVLYHPFAIKDSDGNVIAFATVTRDISVQKQAEEALRESESQLRQLADALPLYVSFVDREERVRLANRIFEEWFDRPREEILGKTLREVLGDEAYALRQPWIEAALRGERVRFEVATPDRSGGYRDTELEYLPRTGPGGTVDGFYAVVKDITERNRAIAALRESERRLRLAMDAGRMAIWELHIPTDTVKISPELNRLLGFPPDATPTAAELRAHYHPDDLERVREAGRAAIARSDRFAEVEFRFIRPDGAIRWLMVRAEIYLDSKGQPDSYVGVAFDVTGRKEAEEALQRSEAALRESDEKFRAIVDSIDQMIWSTRPDGYHDYYNRRWYEYTGVPEGSTDGAGWNGMFHPDDQERAWGVWRHSLTTGEPYHIEYRLRHRSGQYRWVLGRAQPVRDEEGRIIRWFGTCTDIQDLVDAREVLARGREELEILVAERTAELQSANEQLLAEIEERERAEEALRQAQKMEAVGQLTGGIAHDFNNLLAGIVGSLDLLQTRLQQGRTEHIERYAKAAMASAHRAAALTHRLLAFARRQPLDPKPVDANKLVSSMEDLLRRTLGPSVSMELVTAGGLWPTLCDPNQLESAILNLAINARDAMPEGGKLVIETANASLDQAYAATQRDVAPGQYVAICVTDTGTGMPADVIARAFDPFFTTKPIGQGTGLGLSMVYGFAKQSEGHVRIYSEEGRGTTVKIYLPRYRGAADEEEVTAAVSQEAVTGTGETVLVVEDEPVIRDLIIEVLQDLGYQALQATDGPAGLKVLQSKRPIDLLITDVGLPGINGRQLADQAREWRPELKVLFITGYAENAALAAGFLAPGMEMITKPFAVEVLARRIKAMISQD